MCLGMLFNCAGFRSLDINLAFQQFQSTSEDKNSPRIHNFREGSPPSPAVGKAARYRSRSLELKVPCLDVASPPVMVSSENMRSLAHANKLSHVEASHSIHMRASIKGSVCDSPGHSSTS